METLVLTREYQPWARVSWQDALVLLFKGRAEVVEEYQDKTVRSVTLEFKIPSVIRFLQRITGKKKFPKFSRDNIWERDKGHCQYCGKKVLRHEFSYDHVVPRSQGGKTEWTNIVCACTPCNQRKAGRTPQQAGMRLLTEPVRPKRNSNRFRITLTYKPGMPESWATYLTSMAYWNAELDE